MKRLEVGKLYSCSEYFLMLYPDKETARRGHAGGGRLELEALGAAAYWNRKLQNQKPVSYCNPQTPLLILSADKEYVEVLAEDKRGWIINPDWLDIGEITDDAT